MKRYMAVYITICPGSSCQGANIFYTDDELGLQMSYSTTYEEGMKKLRLMEKLLGRPAEMEVNRFNPHISYKEIRGFID